MPDPRRRALLARVHIAKKALCLHQEDYEAILKGFKAESAAELSIEQLDKLDRYMRRLGWKPRGRVMPPRQDDEANKAAARAEALRERARKLAAQLDNGEARLAGLVRRVCGVERIEWCRDASKLKKLLAILGAWINQKKKGGVA